MSKVLLVEPDKMLRHALSTALFPEFEIRAVQRFPDAAPKDVAVVVVDAAALQALEPQSMAAVRKVAEWQLPLVWIEGAKATEPPVKRCIRLSWPVAKDALRGALAQCLNGGSEAKVERAASTISKKTQSAPRRKEKAEPGAANDDGRFIELVDVVEEPSVR
jgi:hypothetical protein